jgi:hypothetical protein
MWECGRGGGLKVLRVEKLDTESSSVERGGKKAPLSIDGRYTQCDLQYEHFGISNAHPPMS